MASRDISRSRRCELRLSYPGTKPPNPSPRPAFAASGYARTVTAIKIAARPVLATLVATLIVACAALSPTGMPSNGIAVRTQPSLAVACPAARIEGTLVRERRSIVGLRIDQDLVLQVIWPYGYSARDDGGRLAVLDSTGTVVAREGDRVAIGGGEIESGTWLGCGGILAPS
jgi:hypothetical protein